MATLSTETFPGADGAVWPATWTTVVGSGGSATQQGGAGRLVTPASMYNRGQVAATLTGMSLVTNTELTGRFRQPVVGAEQYHLIALRTPGPRYTSGGLQGAPMSGFYFTVFNGGFALLRAYDGAAIGPKPASPACGRRDPSSEPGPRARSGSCNRWEGLPSLGPRRPRLGRGRSRLRPRSPAWRRRERAASRRRSSPIRVKRGSRR